MLALDGEWLDAGFHEVRTMGEAGFTDHDDGFTWSEQELRLRCAGQEDTRIICGYCGKRKRAAVEPLTRWYHDHACGVAHILERAA